MLVLTVRPSNVFVVSCTQERAMHKHNKACMIASDVVSHCRMVLLPFVGWHIRGMAVVPREMHTVHTTYATRQPKQGVQTLHASQLRFVARHVHIVSEGFFYHPSSKLVKKLCKHMFGDATLSSLTPSI
jgi:hypothetical protein